MARQRLGFPYAFFAQIQADANITVNPLVCVFQETLPSSRAVSRCFLLYWSGVCFGWPARLAQPASDVGMVSWNHTCPRSEVVLFRGRRSHTASVKGVPRISKARAWKAGGIEPPECSGLVSFENARGETLSIHQRREAGTAPTGPVMAGRWSRPEPRPGCATKRLTSRVLRPRILGPTHTAVPTSGVSSVLRSVVEVAVIPSLVASVVVSMLVAVIPPAVVQLQRGNYHYFREAR